MAPIPRSEQQVEKLIGHIADLTMAIEELTGFLDAPLDARVDVLAVKLEAQEKRLEKLERKPL